MGITDIDDKIIKRSQELDVPFKQLTQQYTEEFLQDMSNLNVSMRHSVKEIRPLEMLSCEY